VCFTGSAVSLDGQALDREDLHDLAEQRGLVPVESVTKKRTKAVIAADAASMSGKAKRARDFGIPVFSVEDFLRWAEQA
jgi:NAD-dependent DNA ligase